MYRRQAVLLGLIEAFGGELGRTDCQKLLFLLTQYEADTKYYDFFPFHYGPFSHIVMQDKRRLTELGHLRDGDGFVLKKAAGHLDRLKAREHDAVVRLAASVGSVRGRELVRRVYLAYPDYCCRSRVTRDVLTEEEWCDVSSTWNTELSPCLFTIGYEGKSIDAILHSITVHNIRSVVDVRRNAISMKHGFSKSALGRYLPASGVRYLHCPELGIPSAMRENLSSPKSYETLFVRYRNEILPRVSASLLELRHHVSEQGRVALLCFEANPDHCHRHVIADSVAGATPGLPLVHLSGKNGVSA